MTYPDFANSSANYAATTSDAEGGLDLDVVRLHGVPNHGRTRNVLFYGQNTK